MFAPEEFLAGIVHEPTQTEGRGIDLTVADIYEVDAPGRIDFGGGELGDATLSSHPSERRHEDDEYEWWHLDAGQYLLTYNERVSASDVVLTVQPRAELLARGGSHPTLYRESLSAVPLSVGGAGLRVKENARVSTVVDVSRTA